MKIVTKNNKKRQTLRDMKKIANFWKENNPSESTPKRRIFWKLSLIVKEEDEDVIVLKAHVNVNLQAIEEIENNQSKRRIFEILHLKTS